MNRWTSNTLDSVPLHASSRLQDLLFFSKVKMCFDLKIRLWAAEQQWLLKLVLVPATLSPSSPLAFYSSAQHSANILHMEGVSDHHHHLDNG